MNNLKINRTQLTNRLLQLYEREISILSENQYLISHSSINSVQRQIDVFEKYINFINPNGKVLDWGCNHAPDSCMIRETLGETIQLYACDFGAPGLYKNFHEFSKIIYNELTDPIHIPYNEQTFDVVIASGVLEHAAMDYESLKELHRIIKEGGYLIITFLPNRLSYTEFASRLTGRAHHLRLYGLKESDAMLRHHGFMPLHASYHQFIPAQRGQLLFKYLRPVNMFLEKLWPIRDFCSNLMFVAKRCSSFS